MGFFTGRDRGPTVGQKVAAKETWVPSSGDSVSFSGNAEIIWEPSREPSLGYIANQLKFISQHLVEIENILNGYEELFKLYEERFKRMDIRLDAISIDSVV
jgi:hypothetical protein